MGGEKAPQWRPDYDKHADETQDTQNTQRAVPTQLRCSAITGTSHTLTGHGAGRLLEHASLTFTEEGEQELSHQRVSQVES